MAQTFIATIAFAIGLLAFCAGAWLTIWATSSNQVVDVAAAKLTGYFITVLALIALVFTSYFIASGVLGGQATIMPAAGKWSDHKNYKGNKSMSKNTSRPSTTNTVTAD